MRTVPRAASRRRLARKSAIDGGPRRNAEGIQPRAGPAAARTGALQTFDRVPNEASTGTSAYGGTDLASDNGRQTMTCPDDRRLAARLHEAEERLSAQRVELSCYEAIVSATEAFIITMSWDGLITDWNAEAEELYGYERKEVLGEHITMLTAADSPELLETMATAVAGAHASFETVNLRKDGSTVQTSVTLAGPRVEGGPVNGIVGVARDISE